MTARLSGALAMRGTYLIYVCVCVCVCVNIFRSYLCVCVRACVRAYVRVYVVRGRNHAVCATSSCVRGVPDLRNEDEDGDGGGDGPTMTQLIRIAMDCSKKQGGVTAVDITSC